MDDSEIEAGGDIDEVDVSLRITADNLDPAWATKLLGRAPTFAAKKGERRMSGEAEVVQPTGVWSYSLPRSTEWILSDAIEALLAQFPDDPTVWNVLNARASVEVCCGLYLDTWNRGAVLPAALVVNLAARHLALDLDIYGNSVELG